MDLARFCMRYVRPSVALAAMGLLVSGACASPGGSGAKAQPSAAVAQDSSSPGPTTAPAASDDDRSIFDNGHGGQRKVQVHVSTSDNNSGDNRVWIEDDDRAMERANEAMKRATESLKWAQAAESNNVQELNGRLAKLYALGDSGETEKGAYLGVTTSTVSAALRHQLSLQRGVGLTVDYVEPGSPAEKAGIKEYDIIERLGDQLLINASQFSVLIRLQKPGDTITLTLIRQSKPVTVQATLTEHDVPVEAESIGSFSIPDFHVRLDNGPGSGKSGTMIFSPMAQPAMIAPGSVKQSVMTYVDDQNRLILTQKDGQDYLTASDLKGKVLFQGPVQTRQQRAAVPEPIATKLRKLREQVAQAPVHDDEEIEVSPVPEVAPVAPATPATPATPPAKQDSMRGHGSRSGESIA